MTSNENTPMEETVWTTALGERKRLEDIDHQHLSNIIWFHKFFNGSDRSNSKTMELMWNRLHHAFGSRLLPWKPLPVPDEVEWIARSKDGGITDDGTIWFSDPKRTSVQLIGSVAHIPHWRTLSSPRKP